MNEAATEFVAVPTDWMKEAPIVAVCTAQRTVLMPVQVLPGGMLIVYQTVNRPVSVGRTVIVSPRAGEIY